jgi:hypothetical protein
MKMLSQVRGLPLSTLLPATPPDSVQTADETPKTEFELPLGLSADTSSILHEVGDGIPLRILPESRKAV